MSKYIEIEWTDQCLDKPDGWYITRREKDDEFKYDNVKTYKTGRVAIVRGKDGGMNYFDLDEGFTGDKLTREEVRFRLSKLYRTMYE